MVLIFFSTVNAFVVMPASLGSTSSRRAQTVASSGSEMDWREMRARLVAAQQSEAGVPAVGSGSNVYESPLIEQGTVLLGGTKMEFGFALRQQFFHKSVMLLLQHDESFTKGIILNRPSALEVEGWRLWWPRPGRRGRSLRRSCRGEGRARDQRAALARPSPSGRAVDARYQGRVLHEPRGRKGAGRGGRRDEG